jgi:hypothetical protein
LKMVMKTGFTSLEYAGKTVGILCVYSRLATPTTPFPIQITELGPTTKPIALCRDSSEIHVSNPVCITKGSCTAAVGDG